MDCDINKILLLFVLITTTFTHPLPAANRAVPGDYATIQAAIEASTNGDVVIVSAGTYSGTGNCDLNLNGKAITIQSTDSSDPAVVAGTIIDCQGSESAPHRAFLFNKKETASSIIDGLTIQNGWSVESGGAVSCSNSSSPTIRNCVFQTNTAAIYGGAVYCTDSSCPTIRQCTFTGNLTTKLSSGAGGLDGGAIYCSTSSNATIANCTFENNSGKSGGAIYLNSSSPAITGCTFKNNFGSNPGGAIVLWISNSAIKNCLFVSNSSNNGGGAVYFAKNSSATLENCSLYGNYSVLSEGGGVACNGAVNSTVKNCILWNDLPDEIKIFSGSMTVSYSDVKGSWTGTGNLNLDPLFADASHGDFHLKSTAGRYVPSDGSWVNDTQTSPCMDAGDSKSSYDQEPTPSGSRVNMGVYGNTAQASKSPGWVTLTAVVDGGNGTVSGSGNYLVGTEVKLTATPNSGYRVLMWSGSDHDPNEGSNTNTVTMTATKTVTVKFDKAPVPTFTLTASVTGEGGTVSPQSGTFDINSIVTLTAVPATGYHLKAWHGTDSDTLTTTTNTVTMTANKTVTVEFEAITYTLTTTANGNGTISPETKDWPEGSVVTLTATPKEGYKVSAWSGTNNDASTDVTNTVTMTKAKSVSVTFVAKTFSFGVSVINGNGTVVASPSAATQSYGTVVTLTATPNTGFRVRAWSGADIVPATASNTNRVTIKGDTAVTVEFEILPAVTHTLSASVVSGGGLVLPTTGVFGENETATITAIPNTGYRVKKWTGTNDDTSKANTNTVTITSDKTVSVEFERYYSITVGVTGEHGSVSPTSGDYATGEMVMLKAKPERGYRVKAWTGKNLTAFAGYNTVVFAISQGDEINVEFEVDPEENCSLISLVAGNHGSLHPFSGVFDRNSVVALTAIPDENYKIKAWKFTDNDSVTTTTNSVTMTQDKTVWVEFEIIRYTLKTSAGSNGSLKIEGQEDNVTQVTYDINTVVTLTATPKEYYKIKSWSGTDDDTLTTLTNTATMTKNRTVSVTFTPITYTLTLSVVKDATGAAHGTLTSSASGSSVNGGTVVTLTASPDTGYRVKAWSGTDNDPSAGNATNTVKMTGDKNITVEFEPIPQNSYTLTTEVPTGHGTVSPMSGTYPANTQVTLTATPEEGYQVMSWDGVASNETTYTVTMDSNKTVAVRFEKKIITYTLTASVDGEHGSVVPTSGIYEAGTKVNLIATPEAGYRVLAWTGTDQVPLTGGNENVVTMSADKTVKVTFELIPSQTYAALVVNVTGCGSVSPASGKYYTGTTVPLVAQADAGYHFKSWSGTDNDASTELTNTVTLSTDKTVTAVFEKDTVETYTLTVSIPNGHGTVSPSGGNCLAGITVRLTASPDTGYRVKSWSGTDNDPNAGSTTNLVTMSTNKTVTVEFEAIDGSSASAKILQSSEAESDADGLIQSGDLCGTGSLLLVPFCFAFAILTKANFVGEKPIYSKI